MVFGVNFPPEFLREITRVVTDLLEIVEILGGYFLEELPHAPHRYGIQPIAQARAIELVAKILHELSPLGGAVLLHGFLQMRRDMLHGVIVHFPL